MLIHGWPGSFLEFEQLIGPLVASGHDVIVPSLPGYAFSGRPEAPIGPRRTAELFHQLLVDLFGPGQYLLKGGDWGAAIAAWMAQGHPEPVAALHLNPIPVGAADAMPTEAEELARGKCRSGRASREAAET